jgi:threonine dehydratase
MNAHLSMSSAALPRAPSLPDTKAIADAAEFLRELVPPTPQFVWPQVAAAFGAEVWFKHENHTPIGAFKARSVAIYFRELLRRDATVSGVVTATRGNHGQAVGLAARLFKLPATVFVPRGNSVEKNAAMRALGATLIEHGDDFQESREEALRVATRDGLHLVPSYHLDIVKGVATYWAELFRAAPDIDVVYVPIGMGSGICAAAAARNLLSPRTKIVGVCSSHALASSRSFAARAVIEAPVATKLGDGMACRKLDAESIAIMVDNVERIVEVTDAELAEAMRAIFRLTHNVAEGAGAAGFAAAWRERESLAGKRVGLSITGGNVDAPVFADVLAGKY